MMANCRRLVPGSAARRFGVLLLLTMATCAVFQARADLEPGIYTCVDAKGRKLTSDRSIPECTDREQKILNPSGTVKARIGPTLTAQEIILLEEKKKAEQVERSRQEEEKKRDRALLIRYPTPASHQKERVAALEHIARVKQTADARVAQLLQDQSRLSDEMAFYEKDPSKAPAKVLRQIDELKQALAGQQRFLVERDSEAERVNARFDEEAARLTPLWRLASTKSPSTP